MNSFVQGVNLTAASKDAGAGTEVFRFSKVALRPASTSSKVSVAVLGQITYEGAGGYDAIGHAIGTFGYALMNSLGQTAGLIIGAEGKTEVIAGTVTSCVSVQAGLGNVAAGGVVTNWAGVNASISGNSGTITNAISFKANAPVGVAPVNVIGLSMPDCAGSATTAAVLGQVSAGTGKYNLCCTGTADNLLAGTLLLNSGKITFPAAQSASSNANTLDDYEEGTWTPSQGAGLTVVGAFSSGGKYTKFGNMVTVQGWFAGATSVAASAGILCGNLPFTVDGANTTQMATGNAVNTTLSAAHIYAMATTAQLNSAQAIPSAQYINFTLTYRVP